VDIKPVVLLLSEYLLCFLQRRFIFFQHFSWSLLSFSYSLFPAFPFSRKNLSVSEAFSSVSSVHF